MPLDAEYYENHLLTLVEGYNAFLTSIDSYYDYLGYQAEQEAEGAWLRHAEMGSLCDPEYYEGWN